MTTQPDFRPTQRVPRSLQVAAAQQATQNTATVTAVAALWALMGDDFDSSWRRIREGVFTLLTGGQLGAARQAVRTSPLVLAELGITAPLQAEPVPEAFAGWASDGRPLESLLDLAPVRAKQAVAQGVSVPEALDVGGRFLGGVVESEVEDAGRGAEQVDIASRTTNVGWVRMVNVPCCPRCAILAGKFFRWNRGFDRHPPTCRCRHIPAEESVARDLVVNPDRLVEEGHIRGLTAGQRKALEDGADLAQVVNASRGMSRVGVTTEGTTRRGRAYATLGGRRPRLTPQGIYDLVGDDRVEARRLLAANGYLR